LQNKSAHHSLQIRVEAEPLPCKRSFISALPVDKLHANLQQPSTCAQPTLLLHTGVAPMLTLPYRYLKQHSATQTLQRAT
jgi:hypothetical protein